MSTTNNEPMVTLKITCNEGDRELLLTVTAAAQAALEEVRKHARWIYPMKRDSTDGSMEPAFIDGKDDASALDYLVGLFTECDIVMLTANLQGGADCCMGLEDQDSDVAVARNDEPIIGSVILRYIDDVDGESNLLDSLRHTPQLIVEIERDENGQDVTTVYVRNTDKSVDKLVANAPVILAALSKVHANDARA